jgi:hypothetical protein
MLFLCLSGKAVLNSLVHITPLCGQTSRQISQTAGDSACDTKAKFWRPTIVQCVATLHKLLGVLGRCCPCRFATSTV